MAEKLSGYEHRRQYAYAVRVTELDEDGRPLRTVVTTNGRKLLVETWVRVEPAHDGG